jgi:hypothetical protein
MKFFHRSLKNISIIVQAILKFLENQISADDFSEGCENEQGLNKNDL